MSIFPSKHDFQYKSNLLRVISCMSVPVLQLWAVPLLFLAALRAQCRDPVELYGTSAKQIPGSNIDRTLIGS